MFYLVDPTIKVEYFISLMNISAVSPFTSIRILIHSLRATGAEPSYLPGFDFRSVSNLA